MSDTVKPVPPSSKGSGGGINSGGSIVTEPLKENVLHSPVRETNRNLHEMT